MIMIKLIGSLLPQSSFSRRRDCSADKEPRPFRENRRCLNSFCFDNCLMMKAMFSEPVFGILDDRKVYLFKQIWITCCRRRLS